MNLGEAAVAYAERGWPVFPLAPRDKVPAVPKRAGGNGLHDATTDASRVARWWARHPDHNIGLRTGVVFDVLDCDGADALEAVLGVSPDLDGPTVLTGKGAHVYVTPTGLGNRARFIDGCDWRGDGGYVVAPPSVHPNGELYRWVDGSGPHVELEAVPAALLEAMRPPAVPMAPRHFYKNVEVGAYGRRALEAEVGRVALAVVGERNDQLNRSAFALGQLVAGGELDAEEAVDALLLAAGRAGLGALEAERTVASGFASGMLSPRSAA